MSHGVLSAPIVFLFALVVGAVLASESRASTLLARQHVEDGPQLAGGKVFFLLAHSEDGYSLRVGTPDGRVRTAATGRERGSAPGGRRYSFDAAPGRFGLEASRLHDEGDQGTSDPSAGVTITYHASRLLVGPTERSPSAVARCSGAGENFPYAVGERFVAFIDECPSTELDETGSPRLRYLDFSDTTPRRQTITLANGRFLEDPNADRLRVAGSWAAADATVSNTGPPPPYAFSPTIVLDLENGREAYRVERYRAPYPGPGLVSGSALGPNGTLVTVSGADECRGALAFYTPTEPRSHPLPGAACATAIEMDGNRFLYIGRTGGSDALMLGDTAGTPPRPIALAVHSTFGPFDLEGRYAAYSVGTCGGTRAVRLTSVERPDLRPPRDSSCPVRLLSRRARLRGGGIVPIQLRCPRGCEGYATLRAPLRGKKGQRRLRAVALGRLASRGPTTLVRLRISAKLSSRLSNGTSRARLDLSSYDLTSKLITSRTPLRLRVAHSGR